MSLAGRPRSQNPKMHVASLRLTEQEKVALEVTYGSASKGLRVAVDGLFGGRVEMRTEAAGAATAGQLEAGEEVRPVDWMRPLEVVAEPDPIGAKDVETPKHYHKPATKVGDVFYRDGSPMQGWVCSCGTKIERKAT